MRIHLSHILSIRSVSYLSLERYPLVLAAIGALLLLGGIGGLLGDDLSEIVLLEVALLEAAGGLDLGAAEDGALGALALGDGGLMEKVKEENNFGLKEIEKLIDNATETFSEKTADLVLWKARVIKLEEENSNLLVKFDKLQNTFKRLLDIIKIDSFLIYERTV